MPDFSGQSIDRYHIIEPLGQGGMATVYRAYDTRLEREVAIKFIRKEAFVPEMLDQILKRFEREAKALAKLSHPNIIKIYDYGEHAGSPYLVMELISGGSLKQMLMPGKPLPTLDAVRMIGMVARALEYAHSQGIIHRDIKPGNILISPSGMPLLTDFGIAKILEDNSSTILTGTGVGMGTPEYMAPEQWFNQVSPLIDVYSLGVVLYEMVTGHKPYTADTPAAVLLKQANEPLPRPSGYNPDLPDEVEQVIFKAMAKNPQERYADMGAFASALEKLSSVIETKAVATAKPAEASVLESQATLQQPGNLVHEPAAKPPEFAIRPEPKTGTGSSSRKLFFFIGIPVLLIFLGFLCFGSIRLVAKLGQIANKRLGMTSTAAVEALLQPTETVSIPPTSTRTPLPTLTATDATSPTPEATAFPVEAFLGNWINVDPDTDGITWVEITKNNDTLSIHMWGKCHPSYCDWHTVEVNASDANDGNLAVTWKFSFAEEAQRIYFADNGRLVVDSYTNFTDNSGRDNYASKYVFSRVSQGELSPKLELISYEKEAEGTRFIIGVTNWADFPDEIFKEAPELPPCGLNNNSSRTWIEIFNGDNSDYIYGYCALGASSDLKDFWFFIPNDESIPRSVYVEVVDRMKDSIYRSDYLPLPSIESNAIAHYPLIADAQDATGQNGPMTLKNVPFRDGGAYFNGGSYDSESGFIAMTPPLEKLDFNALSIEADFKVSEYRTMPVFMGGMLYRWLGFYLDADGSVRMKYNNNNIANCNLNYQLNTWQHGLITYDGRVGNLYLDGKLGCSVTFAIKHGNASEITMADYSNAMTFKGILKDLRIYNGVIAP